MRRVLLAQQIAPGIAKALVFLRLRWQLVANAITMSHALHNLEQRRVNGDAARGTHVLPLRACDCLRIRIDHLAEVPTSR